MSRLLAALVCLPLLAASTAPQAFAQPAAARSLAGTVVDASGGVIPGATVTLVRRTAAPLVVTTDATGVFRVDDAPAGDVRLTVAAAGFATAQIVARPGSGDLRVVLQPAGVEESVSVDAPFVLPTRTRTATRTATELRDVPQAVTVVSSAQIAEMSMQSIGDVVRYVPGVGIAQGEGNRDTPVLRGNATTADFFVDGIRDDVQYFRDLYNVDRVEALKGPNAMIFGRGGVGGVINRVTKQADWMRRRQLTLQAGTWDNRRLTADLANALTNTAAFRVTGLFEDSGSYRNGVTIERQGINPTVALRAGVRTTVTLGFEYFHDRRTADRGVPSAGGRPVETDASTFFGDPDTSYSEATVNIVAATVEHELGGGIQLRNGTLVANYDKLYQNIFPGAANAAAGTVSISGYNNGTDRTNVFNQTDLTLVRRAAGLTHRLLFGVEVGRQSTDNLRQTAFFDAVSPTATTLTVPLSAPTIRTAPTFAPSATDADNSGVATTAAAYVQDQVSLGRFVEVVAGVRYDRFDVDITNNRTGAELQATDNLVSPRVGLIYKPAALVSVYTSYSLSYLPRAGEQLSSLSVSTRALDPEMFRNYEVGAKWDPRPSLSVSAAVYQLDRTNVAVTDPQDPTRTVLVDGQRARGLELGVSGLVTPSWSVTGAYARQAGEITATQSASVPAGARLGQLPAHTFSLWNRYDFTDRVGAGLGIVHRGAFFPSTDNTVVVPGFTRVDAAVFVGLNRHLGVQVNVENLADEDYFASAHNNNNITPGSPRAVRVALTTRF
jgi:catecholate siderophore receptor